MPTRLGNRGFGRIALLSVAISWSLTLTGRAQEVVPLSNAPHQSGRTQTDGKPPEVEVVETRRSIAWPDTIERPAGKFILVLVNKSPDPVQSFQIDLADVVDKALGQNPLLRLDGRPAPLQKHKLADLIDLPAGEFHLKSARTGTTLCTITGK